jgi:integrase
VTLIEPACWSWPIPEATDDRFLAFHVGSQKLARCAICGRAERKLVDDHDHRTGLRRGLLCRGCNVSEGNQQHGLIFARYRERHPAAILGHSEFYVGRGWPDGWWTQSGLAKLLTGDPDWTPGRIVTRQGGDPLRALTTRRVYAAAWRVYLAWCERLAIDALPVAESQVLDYISHLTFATTLAPTSVRVAVAAIAHVHRGFSGSPGWQGGTFVEAALKAMERVRRTAGWSARPARALSIAEAASVQAAADADGPRSSALIALMAGSGARVADLVAAQVQDLDGPLLRMGDRDHRLDSDVYHRVFLYLVSRGPGPGPLFTTDTGQPLQATQVRRVLLRCAAAAGVDPRGLSAVSLRRFSTGKTGR